MDPTGAQALQNMLLGRMAEGICVARRSDGIIVYVNRAWEAMYGYEAGALLGQHVAVTAGMTPEGFEETGRHVRTALERDGLWHGEVPAIRRDGTPFWCRMSVSRFAHSDLGVLSVTVQTDVTQQREALEALRRSEQRLREAQQVAHVGSWEWDLEHGVANWSEETWHILGADSRSGPAGLEESLALVHPDDRAGLMAVAGGAEESLAPFSHELRIARPDGTIRVAHVRGQFVAGADGRPVRMFGTLQDVTERSQAAQAVVHSEALHRNLVRHLPDTAVLLFDHDLRYSLAGGPALENAGWHADRIVGRTLGEVLPPEEHAPLIPLHRAALDGREQTVEMTAANGRHYETRFVPLRDDGGTVTSAMVVARDLTRDRQTDAALRDAEERFRLAVDNAPVGMALGTADGGFLRVNRALCESVGYAEDELLVRGLHDLVHPDDMDVHVAQLRRIWDGDTRGYQAETRWFHADGHLLACNLRVSIVRDAQDAPLYWVGQVEDVTERKRQTEQLAAARDEALEASRLKSQFLANMSHEIRTPLNGVIGMIELLHDTGLSAEQQEYVQTANGSADALLQIINDVLDFSKIEAGRLDLEISDVELAEVVGDVCEVLGPRARAKRVELASIVEADVPARVRGDEARLRQILTNLVANAVKFTDAGHVVVSVGVDGHRPPLDDAVRVRFQVTDTGVGIDAGDAGRLFEPFVQADTTTTRRFGGTGLGLAISAQLTQIMGGEIEADGRPGAGSTFSFTVPLPRASPADAAEDLAGLRVLVVDDSDVNRTILLRQLAARAADAHGAENAPAALDALTRAARRDVPFDLAVLDLDLPGLDGLALAEVIRSEPVLASLPLILLSSGGADPGAVRRAGVDVLLSKPVRQRRLLSAVAEARRATLPRTGDDDAPLARARPVRAHERLPILVVEDNPVNQMVAARMLERRGYRAHLAATGHEALDALSRRAYGAILMDCQMPGLDGYETTRRIRLLPGAQRETPVIAMTAHALKGDRQRCLAAGMDDYMSKPVNGAKLDAVLERWVERRVAVSGVIDEVMLSQLRIELETDFTRHVEAFLDSAEEGVAQLRRHADRGNWGDVVREAHRLAGGAAVFGALLLTERCLELEQVAGARDAGGSDELVAGLPEVLAETRAALTAALVAP